MLPSIAVREKLGTLLAADATTLAPAVTGNKMQLIIAAFALSENLVIGDLTLATTGGLAPVVCATGAQETGLDPATQEQLITIVPGAGSGFRWLSSGGSGWPVTVYGAALTDNGGTTLLAVMQFAQPIVITGPGYQIDIDPQTIRFVLNPMS